LKRWQKDKMTDTPKILTTEQVKKLNELLVAMIGAGVVRIIGSGFRTDGRTVTMISLYGVHPSIDNKFLVKQSEAK
jgi:hypothetical protein